MSIISFWRFSKPQNWRLFDFQHISTNLELRIYSTIRICQKSMLCLYALQFFYTYTLYHIYLWSLSAKELKCKCKWLTLMSFCKSIPIHVKIFLIGKIIPFNIIDPCPIGSKYIKMHKFERRKFFSLIWSHLS
jgi:hypothetical protein